MVSATQIMHSILTVLWLGTRSILEDCEAASEKD